MVPGASNAPANIDARTVEGFGDEWSRFDQSEMTDQELGSLFDAYFAVFPWGELPQEAIGFDAGCGSGRWARLAARRVHELHCVDASDEALAVARRTLAESANVHFHHASVDELPFEDGSMDFGYSLGVLHHVPDTAAGLQSCVRKLRPGAPMLVYLYYAFDGRPAWFRALWRAADLLRRGISRLPYRGQSAVAALIAVAVYLPLARLARLGEMLGRDVGNFPLSFYRRRSLYTMRTDARDRFGTNLEHRFTRGEIESMMRAAGLGRIEFHEDEPFWCAVGRRRAD